jgi:hypothetical protein
MRIPHTPKAPSAIREAYPVAAINAFRSFLATVIIVLDVR